MCLRCDARRPLTEQEKIQAEVYKTLNWSLLYGRQGYGKNHAAAQKVRERVWALRNGEVCHSLPEMPQKICNYRKPKVYWFGELHGSNNFIHNASMRASHWNVDVDRLTLKGMDPKYGLSVFPPMGSTTGRHRDADPLKGKRFISLSDLGDDWVKAQTLDVSSKAWVPQDQLFISSGKPLRVYPKIDDKGRNESSS